MRLAVYIDYKIENNNRTVLIKKLQHKVQMKLIISYILISGRSDHTGQHGCEFENREAGSVLVMSLQLGRNHQDVRVDVCYLENYYYNINERSLERAVYVEYYNVSKLDSLLLLYYYIVDFFMSPCLPPPRDHDEFWLKPPMDGFFGFLFLRPQALHTGSPLLFRLHRVVVFVEQLAQATPERLFPVCWNCSSIHDGPGLPVWKIAYCWVTCMLPSGGPRPTS
ncbi:hypothetical protein AGLY_009485 [Aphis glycines]|uniref:Uncharacterized protein n=1 Tax=Aphis glycines TaxID=307491 RepID=A0A6G0TIV4_APHGL|nr:hypothetical protein AGLY_009485 [Aphis glycines]